MTICHSSQLVGLTLNMLEYPKRTGSSVVRALYRNQGVLGSIPSQFITFNMSMRSSENMSHSIKNAGLVVIDSGNPRVFPAVPGPIPDNTHTRAGRVRVFPGMGTGYKGYTRFSDLCAGYLLYCTIIIQNHYIN